MDNNDPWLDRFKGDILEDRLHKILPPLVRREFHVRHPRPVWHDSFVRVFGANRRLIDDIYAAGDACKITDYEEACLLAADLIMRARRNSDDATIWFAVEASGIIRKDDIDHARQSAAALTKMYDQDAIPLVCGYRISDQRREQAREQGVHVFINPDNDYPA